MYVYDKNVQQRECDDLSCALFVFHKSPCYQLCFFKPYINLVDILLCSGVG